MPKSIYINILCGIALTSLAISHLLGIVIPYSAYILVAFCWLLITSIGSFNILWNYHLVSLNYQANPSSKQIAITFDDGPHPIHTPQVLALLKKYNAQASFFCIGKNIAAHPELLKTIVAEGHIVGNHTYHHSEWIGFFSAANVFKEIDTTNSLVERLIQKEMQLFRPPFGVTNPLIRRALWHSKHQSIGWNVRSLDTVIKDENRILQRITRKLKAGDIILLHDTSPRTVAVLEALLIFLQKKQYKSVTLDTLLNIKAYA